jgi:DNA-binding CsgD family transcriptional regulator
MDTSPAGVPTLRTPGSPQPTEEGDLVGRARELDAVYGFLDEAAARGGALVLCGETGVGRTALLDAAEGRARRGGATVLRSGGAAARADRALGALAEILRPIRHELHRLDHPRRSALDEAIGVTGGPPPGRLQVCIATLAVLRAVGRDSGLVLVVDDLQDIDPDSAATLAFVGRRLAGSRVALLAAVDLAGSTAPPAGLAQLQIAPLAAADSARLVRNSFPGVPAHLVDAVVAEGAGNPLALRELAADAARAERSAAAPGPHLQERFAVRIRPLPAATRRALLLAALGGDDVVAVLTASPHVADLLEPAERAGLVEVDGSSGAVRFRHPLVRSTVRRLATPGERREVHRVLARHLVDRPERRLRHLADAAVAPDERLARLAQRTAWHVLRRGDAVAAVSLLTRAASLGRGRRSRGGRLAAAAYVAAHGTGDLSSAPLLLAAARRADPGHGSPYTPITQAYCLLHGEGEVGDAHRLLVSALAGRRDLDRPDPAVVAGLHALVDVAAWAGRPDLWASVRESAGDPGVSRSTGLHLRAAVLADPAGVSREAAASLDEEIRRLGTEPDPIRITRVAALGLALDRVAECREPLRRVLDDARTGRSLAAATTASALLCAGDVATGRWDEAGELGHRGIELCEQHGHRPAAASLRLSQALMAAARGDEVRTRTLVDAIAAWAAPRGVRTVVDEGRRVLALAALGRGDVEDAYRHAGAVTAPGRLATSSTAALRVSMDLVEAAVRLGRPEEARRHVQAMRDAPVHAVSARFAMLTAASEALVAEPDLAEASFQEALAAPGAERWPFDQARIQLAYGRHLRLQRRAAPSRVFLAAALDTFQRLEALPWAAQAQHGLRATGVTIGRPVEPGAAADLTPDERAAASLAAAGLTNKQIARRLMVSHHTVAARLYQAFPKLGVGSRAALRLAMLDLDRETAGQLASDAS